MPPWSRTVHPRVCGEQVTTYLQNIGRAGSSPRVRGTVGVSKLFVARRRFIPACAGNRAFTGIGHSPEAVHPRVCGEQRDQLGMVRPTSGSSPRVRGTGRVVMSSATPQRFIPACAGNRVPGARVPQSATVHPRVCGEQVAVRLRSLALQRFIPACAGNRRCVATRSAYTTVHPRVCGEQVIYRNNLVA